MSQLPQSGAIATFTVDQQSSRELRQYLTNVVEQCACPATPDDDVTSGFGSGGWCSAPRVVVIDNLHHVTSLGDAFGRFLSDSGRPHWYADCATLFRHPQNSVMDHGIN